MPNLPPNYKVLQNAANVQCSRIFTTACGLRHIILEKTIFLQAPFAKLVVHEQKIHHSFYVAVAYNLRDLLSQIVVDGIY